MEQTKTKLIEKMFMRTNQLLKIIGTALVIAACGNSKNMVTPEEESVVLSDQVMMSTLWLQHSSEAMVLRMQAYERAEGKFKENLKKHKPGELMAVIVDLDETVFDNSPYMARLVKSGADYEEESWSSWVSEGKADLVPGAYDFLKKVESRGVEVFYISNRKTELMGATLESMVENDLPFADEGHVLLMSEGPDKTQRREEVGSNYKVLLLVGDQLTDFTQDLEQFSMDLPEFDAVMDSVSNYFVLLPNPMYGGFENLIYRGAENLNNKDKNEMRRKALNTKQD